MVPAVSASPGWTSSLPVDRTTTRGRGRTRTVPRPMAASRAICGGPRTVPAARARSPACTSLPRARTCARASAARCTRTSPPACSGAALAGVIPAAAPPPVPPSVHSTGTTASAPGGSGAPVMIRAASPGPTVGSSPLPAATSPTTVSTAGNSSLTPWTSAVRTA